MGKTYEEIKEELISYLPDDYAGREEFITELHRLQGDDTAKIGQLNVLAVRYFPEPTEDWQMSIRLLAQNGEL